MVRMRIVNSETKVKPEPKKMSKELEKAISDAVAKESEPAIKMTP